ncbi:MAG: 2-iminoacetate synthase ThiH [Succinivibrio sp.]|nr:2-iminoacetate synthase ThiH [Succinivibrio sp.]MBQ8477017.1 2-iminoacetate synthase ThiH [Succinivibrio sp.]MCI5637909.1 2-iminoacetate synthase ThiH [Succinivibrio sp.]MDY3107067.1 2-iminoacetate synthase ThiH [Succinivibrio sp.]MDY4992068.1 2-iminoacetate synthase ThiH [Succinivibrio sp.]
MSFFDVLSKYDVDKFKELVDSKTDKDIELALAKQGAHTIDDFAALISERARTHYLDVMVQMSMQLTRKRFGRCINMYLPLYLTNLCSNKCAYCGFSVANKFKRVVLTLEEIEEELQAMNKMGYTNILLVSGENSHKAGMPYFEQVLPLAKNYADYLQMEVQPLETDEYARLKELGLDAVSVYQETYHPEYYKKVHLAGKKADMRFRMETPDRLGQAGIDKVGMGALLGLYDWKVDLVATAMHVLYMRDKYWKTNLSISFPRLRPAQGGFEPHSPVSDAKLLQIICAWRIFDNELDLTISTRESAQFRDLILPVGITALSAGSSTEPGGYAHKGQNLEQWTVNDARPVDEVVKVMEESGFDAVFHNASTTYFKAV